VKVRGVAPNVLRPSDLRDSVGAPAVRLPRLLFPTLLSRSFVGDPYGGLFPDLPPVSPVGQFSAFVPMVLLAYRTTFFWFCPFTAGCGLAPLGRPLVFPALFRCSASEILFLRFSPGCNRFSTTLIPTPRPYFFITRFFFFAISHHKLLDRPVFFPLFPFRRLFPSPFYRRLKPRVLNWKSPCHPFISLRGPCPEGLSRPDQGRTLSRRHPHVHLIAFSLHQFLLARLFE